MNKKIARELIKVAKELVSGKDKLFIMKQNNTLTLWISYSPGSGMTSIVTDKKGLTNKKGDSQYDSIVEKIAKQYPNDKVIDVPIYNYDRFINPSYNRTEADYDVFGGEQKPIKKSYMTISKDKYIVIDLFKTKGEAKSWLKSVK